MHRQDFVRKPAREHYYRILTSGNSLVGLGWNPLATSHVRVVDAQVTASKTEWIVVEHEYEGKFCSRWRLAESKGLAVAGSGNLCLDPGNMKRGNFQFLQNLRHDLVYPLHEF